LLFISGEAGLGKTALLEQWTQSLSRQRAAGAKAAVAWGRCLPQSAAAEPYLPVLDALENLGRELGRPFVETLRTHAPALLLQLRGLVPAEERGKIREEASGSTREGMLREITSALEALSRLAPLAIVLEDLQWSDPFTIELLRSIARRTTSARLMILATCRSDEAARLNPQLLEAQSDLELHDQCRTISLAPLSERDAAVFLHVACSGLDFPDRQARDIHRRCGGNPLFMACLSGELARSSKGTGVNDIVPDILRRMFELQATRLSTAEREMLEAAAVAGESFSAGAVAETLNWDPDATESMCETLAGPDAFLKHAPPFFLPDGSERPAYSFRHELCRDALYRLIPTGRRARYHDALGRAGQARRGARLFVVEGVAGVASATRPRTCPAPLAS
jgi:predicted ATPase